MKVSIKFNTKSTSSQIGSSIKLAKQLDGQPYSENNKLMLVEGDHKSRNLVKLLGQVSNLAKTEVTFNNEYIDTPIELYNILSCIRQSYCDGHCVTGYQLFNDLFCELGITEKPPFHFAGIDEFYLKDLYQNAPQVITSDTKNEITIDIKLLIDAYKESTQTIKIVCEKFNAQTIISKLLTLPSFVTLSKNQNGHYDLDDEDDNCDVEYPDDSQNINLQSSFNADCSASTILSSSATIILSS